MITFAVLIALAILAFYVTGVVVSTGAGLAGYELSRDFVVLSASLLVVAALLGGVPFGMPSGQQGSVGDGEPNAGFE